MNAQSNKISKQQLQDKLKRVLSDDVASIEDFNVFIINTPKGQMKIKSKLSLEEFKNQFKKDEKEKSNIDTIPKETNQSQTKGSQTNKDNKGNCV